MGYKLIFSEKVPTAQEQLTLERNMQLPVWIIARYTYKRIGLMKHKF